MTTRAEYTVLLDGLLIAYIRCGPGQLCTTSRHARPGFEEVELAYASISCIDRSHFQELKALATSADNLDGLRFKLQLEGYQVLDGEQRPHAHLKRF